MHGSRNYDSALEQARKAILSHEGQTILAFLQARFEKQKDATVVAVGEYVTPSNTRASELRALIIDLTRQPNA